MLQGPHTIAGWFWFWLGFTIIKDTGEWLWLQIVKWRYRVAVRAWAHAANPAKAHTVDASKLKVTVEAPPGQYRRTTRAIRRDTQALKERNV